MGIRRKEASMRTSKTLFVILIIGSAVAIPPLEASASPAGVIAKRIGKIVIKVAPKLSKEERVGQRLAVRVLGKEAAEKIGSASTRIIGRINSKWGDAAATFALKEIKRNPKFLETYATYGDDVIRFGHKLSPEARRLLTHNPGATLSILRRYGTKAAELEDGKKGTKPHGRADPQKSHRLRRQDAGRFSANCRSSPDGNSSRSHAFPRKCSQRESSSPSTKASISTTVGTGQHTFAFRRRKQEENGHRTGDKKLYAAIVFGSMLS